MKRSKLLFIIIPIIILIIGISLFFILNKKEDNEENIVVDSYIPNIKLDKNGSPIYVDGSEVFTSVSYSSDVIKALNELGSLYGFSDASKEFKVISEDTVDDIKYYKLQQKYNSYPVYGKQIMVSVKDKKVLSFNGRYYKNIDISTTYEIFENEVKEKVKDYVTDKYEIEKIDKYIYIKEDKPILSYVIRLRDTDDYYDLVLSSKGEYIDKVSLYNMTAFNVKTKGIKDKECEITIDKGSDILSTYTMYDPNRNITIIDGSDIGMDFGNENNRKWGNVIYFYIRENNAKVMNVSYKNDKLSYTTVNGDSILKSAVTNMYNFSKVYDYYKNNLGRKSYDNKGKEIKVFIEVKDKALSLSKKNEHNNASYIGGDLGIFTIGSVNGISYGYALDVLAHEFTHGVVEYTAGLIYDKESGALNESYADIMGSLIEGSNFTLAEDIETLRDMSNPNKYKDPDIKDGKYYFPTDTDTYNSDYQKRILERYKEMGKPLDDWRDADSGGVHTNSGVPNHAAYLAYSKGAYASKVQMAKVYYNSLFLMGSNSNFEDSALAVIQAAKNLGLKEEKIKIIEDAFIATKMLTKSNSSVSGKVTDKSSNKSLSGTRVTLVNSLNNEVYYETSSDKNGEYVLEDIPSGNYKAIYEKNKYENYETNIELKEEDNEYDASLNKLDESTYKKSEVIFVMDISYSMDTSDPNDIRKTIISNIVSNLNDDTSIGLVTFTKVGKVISSPSSKSIDRKILVTDIFNITNDNGKNDYSGTNGKAGIQSALSLFSNKNNTNKYIVFLTDGVDNVTGEAITYDNVISDSKNKNIKIISIGLGSGSDIDETILNKLASETNGKYYHATSAIRLSRYGKRIFDELN